MSRHYQSCGGIIHYEQFDGTLSSPPQQIRLTVSLTPACGEKMIKVWYPVIKTTDKTPMYEMPLTFVFGVLGSAFIVFGFWVLVFCLWRFFPRSVVNQSFLIIPLPGTAVQQLTEYCTIIYALLPLAWVSMYASMDRVIIHPHTTNIAVLAWVI